jgi:hypothetical protein
MSVLNAERCLDEGVSLLVLVGVLVLGEGLVLALAMVLALVSVLVLAVVPGLVRGLGLSGFHRVHVEVVMFS